MTYYHDYFLIEFAISPNLSLMILYTPLLLILFQPHLLVFKIPYLLLHIFTFYLLILDKPSHIYFVACSVISLRSLLKHHAIKEPLFFSSPSYHSKHALLILAYIIFAHCTYHYLIVCILIFLYIYFLFTNWNIIKLHEGKRFVCFNQCYIS